MTFYAWVFIVRILQSRMLGLKVVSLPSSQSCNDRQRIQIQVYQSLEFVLLPPYFGICEIVTQIWKNERLMSKSLLTKIYYSLNIW